MSLPPELKPQTVIIQFCLSLCSLASSTAAQLLQLYDISSAMNFKLFLCHLLRRLTKLQQELKHLNCITTLELDLWIQSVQTQLRHGTVWASGLNPEWRCCYSSFNLWIFCSSTCSELQRAPKRHCEHTAGTHYTHQHSHLSVSQWIFSEFWLTASDWIRSNTVYHWSWCAKTFSEMLQIEIFVFLSSPEIWWDSTGPGQTKIIGSESGKGFLEVVI